MNKITLQCFIITILNCPYFSAIADSRLPYPERPHSANQIAQQVFYLLRGMHVKNSITKKNKGKRATLINRSQGKRPSVSTFDNYTNNNDKNSAIETKLLSIFRSGKLKGTGILLTSYDDQDHSPETMIWLPALRKVRRFSSPSHDDAWNGSNLTYGEIFFRRPEHERHKLLGEETFNHCLGSMVIESEAQTKHTKALPDEQCEHKEKQVYKLKSSTLFTDWWYDYRISYIDSSTFAIYRNDYFKDKKKIKFIDTDWQSLHQADRRILYPNYIYAKNLSTNSESLLVIPKETLYWDIKIKDKFWSERTLRNIKR